MEGLSRVERKRAETRARIVREAARHFAREGVDGVRLDELCVHADVSRGTLYNYFPAKEDLVAAIMRPVLARACERVDPLLEVSARKGVEGVVEMYLELYREFPDALRVSYQMQTGPLAPALEALHGRFLGTVVAIFDRAARRGLLRAGDGRIAARAMASVAVPLLETFFTKPGGDALFRDSLRGLLLRDAGE